MKNTFVVNKVSFKANYKIPMEKSVTSAVFFVPDQMPPCSSSTAKVGIKHPSNQSINSFHQTCNASSLLHTFKVLKWCLVKLIYI